METMAIDVKGLEVKRRLQDLERARVTNTWRTVRFRLDGQVFERRLVLYPLDDPAGELNVASPVGRALLLARAVT
jgi:transcription elongation GreA/GreB family factor